MYFKNLMFFKSPSRSWTNLKPLACFYREKFTKASKVNPDVIFFGKGIKDENFKVDKHLRVGHLGRLAA